MSVYNCISHILYIICKLFPKEICIKLLKKKMKIRWQSVFLSFVSDAADFICCFDSLYFEYSVLSCSSSFAFVLSETTFLEMMSPQLSKERKRPYRRLEWSLCVQGSHEMLNISLGKKTNQIAPPHHTLLLRGIDNLRVLRACHCKDVLGYTLRKRLSIVAYLWTCFHSLHFWDGKLFRSN